MRTIKTLWDSYMAILPKDASKTQIQETEMAFYAGATAVLKTILDLGEPGVTEAAGEAILDGLQCEAIAYTVQLAHKAKGAH